MPPGHKMRLLEGGAHSSDGGWTNPDASGLDDVRAIVLPGTPASLARWIGPIDTLFRNHRQWMS